MPWIAALLRIGAQLFARGVIWGAATVGRRVVPFAGRALGRALWEGGRFAGRYTARAAFRAGRAHARRYGPAIRRFVVGRARATGGALGRRVVQALRIPRQTGFTLRGRGTIPLSLPRAIRGFPSALRRAPGQIFRMRQPRAFRFSQFSPPL